jgi:hypothetical protein
MLCMSFVWDRETSFFLTPQKTPFESNVFNVKDPLAVDMSLEFFHIAFLWRHHAVNSAPTSRMFFALPHLYFADPYFFCRDSVIVIWIIANHETRSVLKYFKIHIFVSAPISLLSVRKHSFICNSQPLNMFHDRILWQTLMRCKFVKFSYGSPRTCITTSRRLN